jgi:hypothetical protein
VAFSSIGHTPIVLEPWGDWLKEFETTLRRQNIICLRDTYGNSPFLDPPMINEDEATLYADKQVEGVHLY